MRRMGKKLTALLLALIMLLSLAACGGKDENKNNANKLTGTIYVPEFMDLKLENVDYVSYGCSDGKYVYLLASVKEVDPNAQQSEADTPAVEPRAAVDGSISVDAPADTSEVINYIWRDAIFRVPLDGGEPVELENFQKSSTPEIPEGQDSYQWETNVYISGLRSGADGTIWVTEYVNSWAYATPEDFDPATDQAWNYEYIPGENCQYLRQLDSTGNEISRIETSGLQEKLGLDYMGEVVLDNDGNLYVSNNDSEIFVMDAQMNQLFSVKGENLWGELVRLGDGNVGMRVWGESGAVLKTIDKTAKDWGEEYALPMNANSIYPGSEEYLFYYDQNDDLYGFKAEVAEGEEHGTKILSWVTSDINKNDMNFFSFMPDGRIVVMTNSWRSNGNKMELAILSETDASVMADKTILTYATMYLDYQVRNQIIDFNKKNGKCRIEIKDYSAFNTEDDYTKGLTQLTTEIGAGKVPDMLDTSQMPMTKFGAAGILEDLWPFIDNDAELSRDQLMLRPLEAVSQDGKLYQLVSSFSIRTAVGAKKAVGDRLSWTLADLQEVLANMPEGCTIFGVGDTKANMLDNIMSMNMNDFVDWSTGKCSFNTPEFIALLEFCNSFPLEFDWENFDYESQENPATLMQNGMQLLNQEYIYDFDSMQRAKLMFGSDVSFIGYPKEDGSVGSSFNVNRGIAMSTTCADKEAAWSFIRQSLLPAGDEFGWYYGDFPINKADFDKKAERAMEKNYRRDENGEIMKDENGNPIEESKGGWGWDDLYFDIYATTQEEYDQFMELYNAIDSVSTYDTELFEIIKEVAGSYFSGDKGAQETADLIQSRVSIYINEQR